MSETLRHLKDVGLHIIGSAALMSVAFLESTPLTAGWLWAVCVAAFWFVRELEQDRKKHGRWDITVWSGWKLAEAMAPCATAFGCAIGATIWRLV